MCVAARCRYTRRARGGCVRRKRFDVPPSFTPVPCTAATHPPYRPSLFRTTSAAVMPAANAREKLTQASPYGRARCIDRLLRCTSSTLAREPHPTSTPRSPATFPLPSTAAPPAKPSRNPLCLHLVPARPGFSPVGCASIPDLTLLRRRFARRDAGRRGATQRGYATRAALPLIGTRWFTAIMDYISLSCARALRIHRRSIAASNA